MRLIHILLVFAAAFTASAQTAGHYALQVRDFTELKVTDGINVDYVCSPDSAGYAVFDAASDVASRILFEPKGSKLTIEVSNEEGLPLKLPTVRVYSRYLASIENDGDSLVRAINVAPCPKFKAKLVGNGRLSVRGIDASDVSANITTGNGTITLTGRCEEAVYTIVSTGTIIADDLVAKEAKCRVWGTGTIGCNATAKLSVSGLGSGKVLYTGKPEIKKKAGGVSVNPLK